MYSDKYGITPVREGRRNKLSMSRDNHGEGHVATLLHIPDTEDHEHSHIELNKEQATILRDWLDSWLKDDLDEREKLDEKMKWEKK